MPIETSEVVEVKSITFVNAINIQAPETRTNMLEEDNTVIDTTLYRETVRYRSDTGEIIGREPAPMRQFVFDEALAMRMFDINIPGVGEVSVPGYVVYAIFQQLGDEEPAETSINIPENN